MSEIKEIALFVKRFDRGSNDKRFHFEEFNSLLGKSSDEKYDASYDDIANFIRTCDMIPDKHQVCLTVYKRILVYILIGNTDAHLKNFAMFHTAHGSLALTPMYDIVCSSYYPKLNQLALKINKQEYSLKTKNLVKLGFAFDLSKDDIKSAVKNLETNLKPTFDALNSIENELIVNEAYKKANKIFHANTNQVLIKIINKRWNGSFKGISDYLEKSKN